MLESELRDVSLCLPPVMATLDGEFSVIDSIRCASFAQYVFHLFRCLLRVNFSTHLTLVDVGRFETKSSGETFIN